MDQPAQRMRSYIHALKEEKRKIQVFHRELPLCLDLVNKAIENCRQQLSGTTMEYVHCRQSECSEQTSTQGPVLEEFIPIKRPCSGSDYDDDETEQDSGHKRSEVNGGLVAAAASNNKRKPDWLRSAQLWNQTASDPLPKDDPPKWVSVVEVKQNGGAFQPFNREKGAAVNNGSVGLGSKPSFLSLDKAHSVVPSAATSSTAKTVAARSRKEDREPLQPHRKQRRNWSPELHRRFLLALQQLGGSHVATPKQIRELMKVDGLTNDEVKSHLQKYRLHTRRPGPTTIPVAGMAQAPQFMVVGGIWVSPSEYPASSEEAAKTTVVYAPLASPPIVKLEQKKQRDDSEGRGSHSAGGGVDRSDSPATSSSTHTTTASASRPN